MLIRGGFAWENLFGGDLSRLNGFAALVLAGQTHLSDAEVAAIRAFSGGGGAVILVGDNGRRDENGLERARPAFANRDGGRIARVDTTALRAQGGAAERTTAVPSEAHGTSVSLPEWSKQLAGAIERTAGSRLSVRLRGADTVTLSACELGGNRLAVHLVNYAAGKTSPGLHLALSKRWRAGRK